MDKDIEIFYYTLRASKRDAGDINSPIWNLNVNNLKHGYDKYNVYIQPTFFNGVLTDAGGNTQINNHDPYYEVRIIGQNNSNEYVKDNSQGVILRETATYNTGNGTNKSWLLQYDAQSAINQKNMILLDSNFNFSNLNLEVWSYSNDNTPLYRIVKFSTNTNGLPQDFLIQLKLLFYPKS